MIEVIIAWLFFIAAGSTVLLLAILAAMLPFIILAMIVGIIAKVMGK